MIDIKNAPYSLNTFRAKDFFLFSLGYESRSSFLFNKIRVRIPAENIRFLVFDDYGKYDNTRGLVNSINSQYKIYSINYHDFRSVQEFVRNYYKSSIDEDFCGNGVRIHIDYSSIPRSWYSRLPILFDSILRDCDEIFFWYSAGDYSEKNYNYPSSGIDSFSFFSGKPSLRNRNRSHVVALSYDVVRTEAIVSIVDPEFLVACYAHSHFSGKIQEEIKNRNKHFLDISAMYFSVHLNDFSFMISKFWETAVELLVNGDVVFIPDGPKPLVFAMSLVPYLLNKSGLTCLHVSRNQQFFIPVDVIPTGEVYGFSVTRHRFHNSELSQTLPLPKSLL